MKKITNVFYVILTFCVCIGALVSAETIDSHESAASAINKEIIDDLVNTPVKESAVATNTVVEDVVELAATKTVESISTIPQPEPEPVIETRQLTCADFDPVARPEEVPDILLYASARTGAPAGLIMGVWNTESGSDIDGHVGTASALHQARIRVKWQGKRGRKILQALREYSNQFGWDIRTVRGSKGGSTMKSNKKLVWDEKTGEWVEKGAGYGSCMGPFQTTLTEAQNILAKHDLDWRDYDPTKLCEGAIIAGHELMAHHDTRLRWFKKRGRYKGKPQKASDAAWVWAGLRYFGNASSTKYRNHVFYGRKNNRLRCGWRCWDKMYASGDYTPLIKEATRQANRIKKKRKELASN